MLPFGRREPTKVCLPPDWDLKGWSWRALSTES